MSSPVLSSQAYNFLPQETFDSGAPSPALCQIDSTDLPAVCGSVLVGYWDTLREPRAPAVIRFLAHSDDRFVGYEDEGVTDRTMLIFCTGRLQWLDFLSDSDDRFVGYEDD
ncbi:hypothetical protein RRG08_062666 [Elysia crispata]|uniref:Uncharacterized protein n=1 Tax=Elysia crispata TaxID=231223 RepID=A0AAE0Z6N5_9GAST|nr:hypothetical protein RRG08_062666 [Elysia crispata]